MNNKLRKEIRKIGKGFEVYDDKQKLLLIETGGWKELEAKFLSLIKKERKRFALSVLDEILDEHYKKYYSRPISKAFDNKDGSFGKLRKGEGRYATRPISTLSMIKGAELDEKTSFLIEAIKLTKEAIEGK